MSDLYRDLKQIRDQYRLGELHGLPIFNGYAISHQYDLDKKEDYLSVQFALPDGVLGEIEGGTYAYLQGFRIYREDA